MTTTDPIFAYMESVHGERPWGHVLDAGTGVHSLKWLNGVNARTVTAVTADNGMATRVRTDAQPGPHVELVVGSWTDPELLAGREFDVVVADYLLGAIDGFTPYFQDQLFERLRPHARDRLYAVGLEPWGGARTRAQEHFMELVALRDAAMLLAGHRPYREYPRAWVERALSRSGYTVEETRCFSIHVDNHMVERQAGNVRSQFACVSHAPTRRALEDNLARLLDALAGPAAGEGFAFGCDWVVVARAK